MPDYKIKAFALKESANSDELLLAAESFGHLETADKTAKDSLNAMGVVASGVLLGSNSPDSPIFVEELYGDKEQAKAFFVANFRGRVQVVCS
jgi:hypothetical protein